LLITAEIYDRRNEILGLECTAKIQKPNGSGGGDQYGYGPAYSYARQAPSCIPRATRRAITRVRFDHTLWQLRAHPAENARHILDRELCRWLHQSGPRHVRFGSKPDVRPRSSDVPLYLSKRTLIDGI